MYDVARPMVIFSLGSARKVVEGRAEVVHPSTQLLQKVKEGYTELWGWPGYPARR